MFTTNTHRDKELSETVESLKDDMRRFKEDIKSLLHGVSHAGKESIVSAARHIRSGAEQGAAGLYDRYERARDFSAEKMKLANEQVKAHPYWAAIAAAGVGALLGRFFLRR